MVKVNPTGKCEYYMDGFLKENLDAVKPYVLKDWDMCFVVGGIEGAGKSTLAIQVAHYCAGERFTIDHICFSPKDFQDKILKPNFLQPGDALVLDEGFAINSRSSMSELNRIFLSIMAECRQKNLFLFIICPNFFDLDKNIALWRSRGLFFIYDDKLERGYFRYYSYEQKKKLFVLGKKFYDYKKVKPSFYARFTKAFPLIDIIEYKKRKKFAFENRDFNKKGIAEKQLKQRNLCFKKLNEFGLTQQEIADYLNENGAKATLSGVNMAILSLQAQSQHNTN